MKEAKPRSMSGSGSKTNVFVRSAANGSRPSTGTGRLSSPSQETGRSFRPTIRSLYSTTRRRTSPSMAATSTMSALQAGILSQQLIGPTASGLRWKSIHMGGPYAVFAFSRTADGLCSLKTGRSLLESVAAVMRDITSQNPGEVFLIEGHTDAVGSVVDNLSLSDRRAQAVAEVLSQQFNIPRENLVTQGYGKQFLLIPTDEPERRNRRVVVRRITPLLQGDSDRYSSGYGSPGEPYRR